MLMVGKAVAETVEIFERYWTCEASRPLDLLHPTRRPRSPKPLRAAAFDAGEILGPLDTIDEFIATSRRGGAWRSSRPTSSPAATVRGSSPRWSRVVSASRC